MFFYIIITSISLFLFATADYLYSRRNKLPFYIVMLLFLLFPSLIGGARDFTVGIDIYTYGIEHFQYAAACNSLQELYKDPPSHELGWFTFNYLSSKIVKDLNFFFFLSEFLKLALVSYSAIRLKKRLNPVFFMFTYFMFNYYVGWCYMRQSLAIAICCLALFFYFEKHYIYFILLILVARTFHTSAALMFIFPFFDYLKKWKYSYVMIALAFLFAVSSIYLIVEIVAASGLFRDDFYDLYFDTGVTTAKTCILIVASYIIYGFLTAFEKDKQVRSLILENAVFALAFIMMGQYVKVAFRASFYPILCLMFITLISFNSVRNGGKRLVLYFVITFVFILHFYIESTHELAGTIPYSSKILGVKK